MKWVIEMAILFNALLYTVLFLTLIILAIVFMVWFDKKMKSSESEFIFYVFVCPIILIFVLAFLLVSDGSVPMIFGG